MELGVQAEDLASIPKPNNIQRNSQMWHLLVVSELGR